MTSVALIARAWRTPLGHTIEAAMARLFAGERAAIRDAREGYACTSVAPIAGAPARTRDARFLRRLGLFGLEAAIEALAASGLGGGARVGLFSGVGGLRAHWDDMIAAFANQRDDGERMWDRGLKEVHPYWMLRHLSNNVHALASAELDLRGEGATFGGGNAGAQAIAAASRALRDRAIDAAVVVAYDSLLEPET
ncbi:MAG: beta-ketoacyl synthase N-terminal-like domain-containing protein, partial [Acidobacteriota bacterium]